MEPNDDPDIPTKPVVESETNVEIPVKPIPISETSVELPVKPVPISETSVELPVKPVPISETSMEIPVKPVPISETSVELPVKPVPISETIVELPVTPVQMSETSVEIAMEPIKNQEISIKSKKISNVDSERTSPSVEDDILALFENELKDYPQVFQFIQKLQQIVDRQRKLLQKYHEKFKQFNKDVKHTEVQTIPEDIVKQNTSIPDLKEPIDIQSFKDDIVQAAHNAVQNTGFVYEPVSGLYYDYNTGYYYNSELGLYYDGATSTYYYYNEKEKKFEFHSQVQSQPQQQQQQTQGKQHKQQTLTKDQTVRTKPNEANMSPVHSKSRANFTEPLGTSEDVTPIVDTDMLSDVSSNSDLCTDPETQTKQSASEELSELDQDGSDQSDREDGELTSDEDVDMKEPPLKRSYITRQDVHIPSQDSEMRSVYPKHLYIPPHQRGDKYITSKRSRISPEGVYHGDMPPKDGEIRPQSGDGLQNDESSLQSGTKYRTPLEYYNSPEYRTWYEAYCKSVNVQYTKTPVTYDPNSEEAKTVNPALRTDEYEIANAWPPCLRIIVTETSVKGVKVGTLFIVTNLGGTIGREGEHAVLIPDINISKHHAKISFTGTEDKKDDISKGYTIVDLGSRNGTFVENIRLSAALQESEPHLLTHGTELRIGGTKLSVHIHQGRDTCDQCEPGVLMCAMKKPSPIKVDLTSNSAQNRQAELKRLRKKFGLDKNPVTKATGVGGPGKLNTPGYEDRAERRRKTVGSLVEGEKTQVAHMEESIPNQNKGFKMLSKMGWKSGQTLGKDEANSSALTEPIIPQQYAKNAGLGSSAPVTRPSSDSKEERKKTVWEKTQARYNVLGDEPPPTSNSPEDEH